MAIEALSYPELVAWQPPKVEWLIDHGLLAPGTGMIIYGPEKSYKSWLAMDLGFKLSLGIKWLGLFNTSPVPVLELQSEVTKALFRGRAMKYANGNGLFSNNIWFCCDRYIKLDRPSGFFELRRLVEKHHPKVLIIDPIYKVISGDISNSVDVSHFLDNMDYLKEQGISIILIGHTRKPIISESGQVVNLGMAELIGSSYFGNWVDTGIAMQRQGNSFRLWFTTLRHSEEDIPPMEVKFTPSLRLVATPLEVEDADY